MKIHKKKGGDKMQMKCEIKEELILQRKMQFETEGGGKSV
jgi:hypothetical protein